MAVAISIESVEEKSAAALVIGRMKLNSSDSWMQTAFESSTKQRDVAC